MDGRIDGNDGLLDHPSCLLGPGGHHPVDILTLNERTVCCDVVRGQGVEEWFILGEVVHPHGDVGVVQLFEFWGTSYVFIGVIFDCRSYASLLVDLRLVVEYWSLLMIQPFRVF